MSKLHLIGKLTTLDVIQFFYNQELSKHNVEINQYMLTLI